ncbi:hypothetical protein ACU10_04655 [Xanthomonas oryzae pv. oryzicola]|nr:hypothetical protein ACU13_04675 [Xanthomonas oryzae pv. oryzicola]AKN96176.1 hypothetical protein ACU10_04655 [Xanthomonas oryzae pv. oryzicola]AKO11398.1 hypothetical protein ACU14_04635 [Xanthomonas oryzae pv. oryzicola]AKO15137.1 hypothetical protein ACU12_04670 [Xanthomonas oryzae pv. oryzicola]AKO18838.1 hypothetical protein ACU11_04465 [Xanthomonas oryzae pv. oryzicola]
MTAFGVVEHLDVVEHLRARGVLVEIDLPPDPLAFEQAEEALHRGVVPQVQASRSWQLPRRRMLHTKPWDARKLRLSSLV